MLTSHQFPCSLVTDSASVSKQNSIQIVIYYQWLCMVRMKQYQYTDIFTTTIQYNRFDKGYQYIDIL